VISFAEGIYSYRLNKALRNTEAVVNSHGDMIQKLNRGLEEGKESLADLKGEVSFTKDRLGTTQVELRQAQQASTRAAHQQSEAAAKWTTQLSDLRQAQATTQGTVGNLSSDVAGVKDGLNSTKDQLASTRGDLQRVIGDLGVQSGLIATNRNELEQLRARGERDYFEFNLTKTKQFQRIGNISLSVKKTDTKKQRYTISVISDDRTIEKKDKTVNEPVQFYQAGFRQPSEIVVNQIYKDRIVGYFSVPKKQEVRPTLAQEGADKPHS
jgi:chromosome segregation ATPase